MVREPLTVEKYLTVNNSEEDDNDDIMEDSSEYDGSVSYHINTQPVKKTQIDIDKCSIVAVETGEVFAPIVRTKVDRFIKGFIQYNTKAQYAESDYKDIPILRRGLQFVKTFSQDAVSVVKTDAEMVMIALFKEFNNDIEKDDIKIKRGIDRFVSESKILLGLLKKHGIYDKQELKRAKVRAQIAIQEETEKLLMKAKG